MITKWIGKTIAVLIAVEGAVLTSERVLPLEGGCNFRDLGGYLTADGQRVKWGKLFRSGSMAQLTLADHDYLSKLGIRVVCDLRTNEERHEEPNTWQEVAKLSYWVRDYTLSSGELHKLMATDIMTGEQASAAMIAIYQKLPFEQAPSYRELFKRLAAGDLPLAFNCSAGKDRAGTAAALVLSALGVPRDTVIDDYALSDKVVDFHRRFAAMTEGRTSPVANFPPEVATAVLSSNPDYIRAAFTSIEAGHNSVESYLRDVLEVTPENLRSIRQQLLE